MNNTSLDTQLKDYADAIIRVGVNLQPGQRLVIGAPVATTIGVTTDLAQFVGRLTEAAYDAGAQFVDIIWQDPSAERARLMKANEDTLEIVPQWQIDLLVDYAEQGDAFLSIYSVTPGLFDGIDPDRVGQWRTGVAEARRQIFDRTHHLPTVNRSIVTAATQAWADQILSDLPADQRLNELWNLLFGICRLHTDDSVEAWREHVESLNRRADVLNKSAYSALHLHGPGTDAEIGLPEGHIWASAAFTSDAGILAMANFPSEELFTLPHKDRVNGTIAATMPLAYSGAEIIDGFSLTFENGKVVDFKAERGYQTLKHMLDTDEGSRSLGEIALVANSSPIAQLNRVFFNSLLDENASCHVALGLAFRQNLQNARDLSDDEFAERGGNTSLIHVDFMIGSGQMDIDGIMPDGSTEPLMRAGEWFFDV